MIKFSLSLTLIALNTQALKVGVISDMHTNLDYSPTASDDDNCVGSSAFFSNSDKAPVARFGCDPSPTLVDFML